MQALDKKVIIREDQPPEKIGSIFVPFQIKPQLNTLPHTGVVVSAGKNVNPEIKVGSRVLFSRLSPMVVLEQDRLLVMKEDDIQAILEEDIAYPEINSATNSEKLIVNNIKNIPNA